jgi:uncharacterized damage-inducible protein DinB
VPTDEDVDFPVADPDERELFLRWLRFLRGAVLRDIAGLSDDDARWTPDGKLISVLGVVNHLTGVERRWIDRSMLGEVVTKPDDEYCPGPELTVAAAVEAYQARAEKTDAIVRSLPLTQRVRDDGGYDLRWVLLHLINETARHAGHADATRELLDGTTGE